MKAVKTKIKDEKKVSPEEAMKVLQELEELKRKECWEEIVSVVEKHGFNLGIVYEFALTPKK